MVGLHDHTVSHDLGHSRLTKAAAHQVAARGQTDEAVAAKALATHHGFKQETVATRVL